MRIGTLHGGFMIMSMIGFIISIIALQNISVKWAFSFAFIFMLMFIASIISMTYGTEIPDKDMRGTDKKQFIWEKPKDESEEKKSVKVSAKKARAAKVSRRK